jgi:hypothetical protein
MAGSAERLLPPASSPIEPTTTEQKNDDYNEKKRGRVHGFSVLSVSVFLNIPGPAARSACATYLRRHVARGTGVIRGTVIGRPWFSLG